MSISVRPGDVRARPLSGAVGQVATASHLNKSGTLRNTNVQAAKVTTIVVDTASHNTAYAFTFEGEEISYTSDGSSTKPEITAGLKAAFDANPIARGVASVADDATDTLTFTGLAAGYDFSISESDGNLTLATVTAAAEASAVAPGILCMAISADEGVPVGGAAKSSGLTAQVDTWTVTYDASVLITAEIEVDGLLFNAQHLMATDLETSLTALAAQINAVMPANTVLASSTATTLVLTSEVAGKAFVSGIGFGTGRDTGAASKASNAGVSTDILRAAAGVSIRRYDEEAATVGDSTYTIAALAGVQVLTEGEIWVASSESISYGDPVYVELGSSNSGQFYKTSSATRVLLPPSKFSWVGKGSTSTDNIARLRVSL